MIERGDTRIREGGNEALQAIDKKLTQVASTFDEYDMGAEGLRFRSSVCRPKCMCLRMNPGYPGQAEAQV
jgi:hypothetical protein